MAIHFLITILIFTIPPNLHSEELRKISGCTETRCEIRSDKQLITNHGIFNLQGVSGFENGIYIQATIDAFINYGEIITHNASQQIGVFSFTFNNDNANSGQIKTLTNYGYISGGISSNNNKSIHIVNYGEMGGVSANSATITLNNFGIFNLVSYSNSSTKKAHFHNVALTIQNHTMKIVQSPSAFNSFDGNASDNSHLVLDNVTSVNFSDSSSKIFLDFGGDFLVNEGYLLSKLITDTSGENKISVDFDRLVSTDDFYKLIQQGDYFIAQVFPQHSAIANISKANIRTMNNFYLMSNAMIYPRKLYHLQNLGKKNQNNLVILRERSDRRISKNISSLRDSALDSANHLKSYESFAYRNESINRRIQRQNKRNYNRRLPNQSNSQNLNQTQNLKENQRNLQNLNTDSANRTRESQNLAQNPHDYYFILTPFVNHNYFFESGNYNLSGFDYGFLTAFSAKVAESNSLGAHFMMSYGSLGDSKDKEFMIKSLNLNVGVNYKLDLIWDMFIKTRGDFFYFSNALDSLTIKNIKPNNLGFGASVAFGKDFDFKQGGVLGIEAGLDYKALKTNEVLLNSQTYKQSLYNLIYADVGINYNKYFGGFGINLGTGFKANLAPKLAESALIVNTQTLKFTLDNDKYLGYANAGISYLLNAKSFDMEFSLAYYGNFGDRVMSNGGGVEFRVVW